MIHRLAVLMILTLCNTAASAQSYTPMLDSYNEWNLTSCYFGCLTDPYWTDGDTLVDGKLHKILDGYHYLERKYLLREVVEDRKVYFTWVIDEQNWEEYLLYDFSLEVGESFEMKNPLSPFPLDGGSFILDSIVPRPLVDGALYDHYYFSPAPGNTISDHNAVWVEGVGSLSMVNAAGGDPDITGAGALSCYYKEGSLFYRQLDSIEACVPFLGIAQTLPIQEVSWYMEQGQLHLLKVPVGSQTAVYSLSGQLMEQQLQLPDRSMAFDTRQWANTLYLIRITDRMGRHRTIKVQLRK